MIGRVIARPTFTAINTAYYADIVGYTKYKRHVPDFSSVLFSELSAANNASSYNSFSSVLGIFYNIKDFDHIGLGN